MNEPGAALDSRVAELAAGLTEALVALDIALALISDLMRDGNNYHPAIVHHLRCNVAPLRDLAKRQAQE
jgi:hypothetical protein